MTLPLRLIAPLVAIAALGAITACAPNTTILTVGAGKQFALPSQAVRQARTGDTVEIFPGRYDDCAVWRQDNLSIVGVGDGVVLGPRVCDDKAIFVVAGHDVLIRGLTFTGARTTDHNGAGIRAEGGTLTLEDDKFLDNEDGVLAYLPEGGDITVRAGYFEGNGACIGECAHGIYVSRADRLTVEHSEFFAQHDGHHIKSRALQTTILDNFVHDGPKGTASYLVDIPQSGNVTIIGNRFEKGPLSSNHTTAIAIGAEQNKPQHPTQSIVIRDNTFTNDMARPTVFVRNFSATPAALHGNTLSGPITPLSGPGLASAGPFGSRY